jgi:hypothetical protein
MSIPNDLARGSRKAATATVAVLSASIDSAWLTPARPAAPM